MTASNPIIFSGPFHRAQLANLPQYIASNQYLTIVRWVSLKGHLLAVIGAPDSPIQPVYSTIVGEVSADKLYVGPHGNFSSKFNDPQRAARTAKQMLTLKCPNGNVDFVADWKTAISRLETIQGQIASTPRRLYFIQPEGTEKTLRLGFPLWEERNSMNDTPERNEFTSSYTVNADSTPFWDTLKQTHQCCRMPVYDVNERLIEDVDCLADKLVGSLVEVSFSLRHYHMAAGNGRTDANDTFTASIESITVLRGPLEVLASPHKNTVHKFKPKNVPQTPTRGEHVNAAKAFVPDLTGLSQPEFVEGGSKLASSTELSVPTAPKPVLSNNGAVTTPVSASLEDSAASAVGGSSENEEAIQSRIDAAVAAAVKAALAGISQAATGGTAMERNVSSGSTAANTGSSSAPATAEQTLPAGQSGLMTRKRAGMPSTDPASSTAQDGSDDLVDDEGNARKKMKNKA